MNYKDYENAMVRQVESLPQLVRELYPELEEQTRAVLSTPEIYMLKKIVLTGSGDCYAAALAAQNMFETMLGLPVQVVTPVELARYYQMKWVGETPGDPLVIALSHSGKAARVVEAVKRVRRNGSMVLAVTSDPRSALAVNADKVVDLSVPAFERAPGIRTYAAILMTLYFLAIRLGEVRLKITQERSGAYRQSILRMMDGLESSLEEWEQSVFTYAADKRDAVSAELYGSGYDMGNAVYGSEKMYEAAGLPAVYSDTENWFHVNCFLRDTERTMTLVFADRENPAHSRTVEMVQRMNEMKREFILVTNDRNLKGPVNCVVPDAACMVPDAACVVPDTACVVSDAAFGLMSPLIAFVPAALAAGYAAALRGEEYSRGFKGMWEETDTSYTTVNSRELILE